MRILLIDQPLYNRGDESAFKGLIRNLIKVIPDIEITVLEINAPQAAINEFDLHLSQVNFVNLFLLIHNGTIVLLIMPKCIMLIGFIIFFLQ